MSRIKVLAAGWALLPITAAAQVDTGLAERYFGEARVLCERDGGKLWGTSLCGPMMFADAATGTTATTTSGTPGSSLPGPSRNDQTVGDASPTCSPALAE